MAGKKQRPEEAEARLEDLRVDEVSIVDDPANLQPFVVVKRNGKEVIDMPRGAFPREEAVAHGRIPLDKIDAPVGVTPDAADADDAGIEDLETPPADPGNQVSKSADLIAATEPMVKKLGELVEQLKSTDDVSDTIESEFSAIVDALSSAIGKPSPTGDDVEKKGAKMSQARLEKLSKIADGLSSASETLITLVKELTPGEEETDKKDKPQADPQKTDKVNTPSVDDEKMDKAMEALEKSSAAVADVVKKVSESMTALSTKVDKLAKKVDEIDGVPPGNADDDPPSIQETKKSVWAGLNLVDKQ